MVITRPPPCLSAHHLGFVSWYCANEPPKENFALPLQEGLCHSLQRLSTRLEREIAAAVIEGSNTGEGGLPDPYNMVQLIVKGHVEGFAFSYSAAAGTR